MHMDASANGSLQLAIGQARSSLQLQAGQISCLEPPIQAASFPSFARHFSNFGFELSNFVSWVLPDRENRILLAIGPFFHKEEGTSRSPLGRRGLLGMPLLGVGLAGGENGVPGKGTKHQEGMTCYDVGSRSPGCSRWV